MPQVPFANETPQVQQRGFIDAQASPAAFGGQVGSALDNVAQGLDQVGGAVQQQRQLMAHTAALNTLNMLSSQTDAALYGDPTDPKAAPGFLTLLGENALAAAPKVAQQITDLQAQARTQLEDPLAQREFDQTAGEMGVRLQSEIAQHTSQQQQTYLNDTDAATAQSASASAVTRWSNPDQATPYIRSGVDAVTAQAVRNGLPTQMIAQQRTQYVSGVMADQIRAQAGADDPMGAWSRYVQLRANFTPDDSSKLERDLKLWLWRILAALVPRTSPAAARRRLPGELCKRPAAPASIPR